MTFQGPPSFSSTFKALNLQHFNSRTFKDQAQWVPSVSDGLITDQANKITSIENLQLPATVGTKCLSSASVATIFHVILLIPVARIILPAWTFRWCLEQ